MVIIVNQGKYQVYYSINDKHTGRIQIPNNTLDQYGKIVTGTV